MNLNPQELSIDNTISDFHSWPIARERKQNCGVRNPSLSFAPAIARVRKLELEIDRLQNELQIVGKLQLEINRLQNELQTVPTLELEIDRLQNELKIEKFKNKPLSTRVISRFKNKLKKILASAY